MAEVIATPISLLDAPLGLFMAKTIIEKNMNGRLSVRNSESGAEFRIEV